MPENARSYLRPGAVERLFGRILVFLIRIGVVRGHFYVLEVRGRKSGRMISLPVDPIDLDGRCYLVCARGNANWVRVPVDRDHGFRWKMIAQSGGT